MVAHALQETMEQKYTFLLCIALAVVHHRYDAENAVQNACYKAFAIVAFPKKYYNLYYDVNGGTGTPMIQRNLMFEANQSVRVSTAPAHPGGLQLHRLELEPGRRGAVHAGRRHHAG